MGVTCHRTENVTFAAVKTLNLPNFLAECPVILAFYVKRTSISRMCISDTDISRWETFVGNMRPSNGRHLPQDRKRNIRSCENLKSAQFSCRMSCNIGILRHKDFYKQKMCLCYRYFSWGDVFGKHEAE
jgi:hypothetical protein